MFVTEVKQSAVEDCVLCHDKARPSRTWQMLPLRCDYLDISTVAIFAMGYEVIAVVQLIVGVLEDS